MSQLKGIEISLKPIATGVNRVLPQGINQVMQQEYANRYLESIGAYPTRENIEFVLNNLAIKDALVLPIWARSKIVIIPGMNNRDGVEMGSNMQDILSENHKEGNDEKRTMKGHRKLTNTPIDLEKLYPDAKSSYTNLAGRKMSWTTVNTLDLVEPLMGVLQTNQHIAEHFKVLMRPPEFEQVDIQNALFTFITSLPDYIPRVRHDKTFELFKSVRKLLKSKQCNQLYGLLIHFVYWNIIHPTARHTIQTLRDMQNANEALAFRDVDVSATGMLQVRAQVTGPLRSPNGAPHTPMSVEKMFMDEVLRIDEDSEGMGYNNESTGSQQGSRSRFTSHDFNGSGNGSQPRSRPGSPDANLNRPGSSGDIQRSPSRVRSDSSPQRLGSPHSRGGRSTSASFEDTSLLGEDAENAFPGAGSRPGSPARGISFRNDMGGSLGGASAETEASLSAAEKEQLFMQLEVCLIDLFRQVGKKRADLVTGRQAMVTCCHFVVDEILTAAYPWFATLPTTVQELEHQVHTPAYLDFLNHGRDWNGPYLENIKRLNLRLRRLVHQGMADIIDPSRLYTSSMLLSSVTGKVQTHSLSNKGKSRFYTTSVATKAVLGDSHSDAARRFIQQGRGVYTVLPGVVDPYDSRPTAQLTSTAPKQLIFDVLRQSGEQQNFEGKTTGRTGETPRTARETPRPATGRETATEEEEPAPRRFPNRFPDNHARTMPRPNTTTVVSRTSSANKLATTRGGTANDALKGTASGKKRIDFQRLFDDQPEVGYFPVIKASSQEQAQALQLSTARENDWLDEFVAPGSRASTAEAPPAATSSRVASAQSFGAGSSFRPGTRESSRPATSSSTRPGTAASSHVGFNLSSRNSSSRPDTGASRPSTGVSRPAEEMQAQLEASFVHTTQMFPSGGSIGSASYLSENRSVAHNKSAAMELSLRAKASLMDLLVDKTAALYSTEIQTNLVKTRIALLKKT